MELRSLQPASPLALSSELQSLTNFLSNATASFWRPFAAEWAAVELGPDLHVFLGGFPRSGVEILANFLRRHRAVALLQDRNALSGAARRYLSNAETIRAFTSLDTEGVAAEREIYWSEVRASGLSTSGKVLIDCSPTNAIYLPLVAKFFPSARVVFMQRDPRDIVTSCFTEFPRIANTFPEAYDLPSIAQLLNDVGKIVRTARDRMSLPVAAVRYENLVADPNRSLSAVCEFMELGWERALIERPPSDARENDFGYLSEQAGMWRMWAEQFSSMLPLLAPWLEEGDYR
jgi:hypothetical protein